MTRNQLARTMYNAYAVAAFGQRARSFDALRNHEKGWWVEAAEHVADELWLDCRYQEHSEPVDDSNDRGFI